MKMLVILLFLSATAHAGLQSKIESYESRSDVLSSIARIKKIVLPRSKGLCAKHVRLGYMYSGMIPSHPGINYAKNYQPYFERQGWSNLYSATYKKQLDANLFKTPSGCAVVYSAIDARNDRNGHIGHIEMRIKGSKWGFISDYYSPDPRTGRKCLKPGKVITRLKTFTARSGSPYYKKGQRVKRYIKVTTCDKYSTNAASAIGNEFNNRKVIGVNCKF